MRVYLAGPMKGIPELNRPAFRTAADNLRGLGDVVFNPADSHGDAPIDEATGAAGGRSRADWLKMDLAIVANWAEAVVLIPGWRNSRGAVLEANAAMEFGLEVWEYEPKANGFEMYPVKELHLEVYLG